MGLDDNYSYKKNSWGSTSGQSFWRSWLLPQLSKHVFLIAMHFKGLTLIVISKVSPLKMYCNAWAYGTVSVCLSVMLLFKWMSSIGLVLSLKINVGFCQSSVAKKSLLHYNCQDNHWPLSKYLFQTSLKINASLSFTCIMKHLQ